VNLRDPYKGIDLLIKALNTLPKSMQSEIILLVMGSGGELIKSEIQVDVMAFGYVGIDQLKVMIFAAADLFILPTRADNLPLVLQEAMACGTPMISFDVGGVPDLVRPGITGLLAEPENPQDLARKIEQLLVDRETRQKMSQNCREVAVQEYDLALQAQRYIQIYQQALANFSS